LDLAEKLVAYARDSDHPRGRHKARVFRSALGIGPGDWRYLHDRLLAAVLGAPVRATRITPFGVSYDVYRPHRPGLTGSTYPVATVLLVEGDCAPRLVFDLGGHP
jgi:hypothetical protein